MDEGEEALSAAAEGRPATLFSSSDVQNEPCLHSRNDDSSNDRCKEEDDNIDAGSVLPKLQAETERAPTLSPQTEDPQVLKANPTPDGMVETYPEIILAATVELPYIQHGYSEHLDSADGGFNSKNTIMSSTPGGITELPTRNSPTDQPVQPFVDDRWGMSTYAVQQHNYNFLELHSPVELQMESYQQQNHGLQTQMADVFASSEQRAEWLHLQQQGYVHCDDVVPENGPYASGAPPFVEFSSNVFQQGIGAYSMPSSVTMNFDAVPAPASFGNMALSNLEASQLTEGGDPFGPAQLSARAIYPDQYTQACHNRTLALNSIYDPMYEELGLPVDPYMRLFLMSRHDCS